MILERRAAVLQAPLAVRVARERVAAPGPREVVVRLEGCGVCGSNLPVWEGRPWFSYPREAGSPGHEGWGRVVQVGSDVASVRPGVRVAVLSYHAFADHDVADEDRVVALPAALDGQPFPGEALGCAMNVFVRCAIARGQTVAIVGIGFMGALLTDLCVRAGARVIALSRRTAARRVAERLGAAAALSIADPATALVQVHELTDRLGCERVIEATGLQPALTLAGELCAERGRLIIAGYHQDGPREVNLQLWNWRGLDVINAHERATRTYVDGMRAAAEAVAAGRLNPAPLYTDRFGLDELPRAFAAMRDREGNFMKALLHYA